jgi:DNA-binding transcriptional LysR family regulator
MSESRKPGTAPEFDTEEGLSLALAYLEDPSSVPCPKCGPDKMEVVCYLDARNMEKGRVVPTPPDEDYTVVLYCHGCGRAAALDLSRDEQDRDGS